MSSSSSPRSDAPSNAIPSSSPVNSSSNSLAAPTGSSLADLTTVNESPSIDVLTAGVDATSVGRSEAVDNPFNELTDTQNSGKTFLTGVENFPNDQKQGNSSNELTSGGSFIPLSDEELINQIEKQMLEYERTAQYVEAERARQHVAAVKQRQKDSKKQDLSRIQEEDIRMFFTMVGQHQENFDRIWSQKTLEHKLRADELIEQLKWKHDDQQRELYEQLRKKRMPKFSVELLNMRKKQVLLAKAKSYVEAEKMKRKADMLEAIEIERIRDAAREENQLRFQSLLKKQEWDRKSLAQKLKIEKKCLLEAKAQDFLRLKKRLRNAEQELKKTHIRQQLLAEKKLVPVYSVQQPNGTAQAVPALPAATTALSNSAATANGAGNLNKSGSSTGLSGSQTARGSALRNSGRQRLALSGGASANNTTTSSGSLTARSGSLERNESLGKDRIRV
jgi:hypothetical protein